MYPHLHCHLTFPRHHPGTILNPTTIIMVIITVDMSQRKIHNGLRHLHLTKVGGTRIVTLHLEILPTMTKGIHGKETGEDHPETLQAETESEGDHEVVPVTVETIVTIEIDGTGIETEIVIERGETGRREETGREADHRAEVGLRAAVADTKRARETNGKKVKNLTER